MQNITERKKPKLDRGTITYNKLKKKKIVEERSTTGDAGEVVIVDLLHQNTEHVDDIQRLSGG